MITLDVQLFIHSILIYERDSNTLALNCSLRVEQKLYLKIYRKEKNNAQLTFLDKQFD